MDARILSASRAEGHRPPVTSHESPLRWCKPFRFTLLSKNAPANHLESHSCKNKGLKVPCFHTLTKKGVGEGGLFGAVDESSITNHGPQVTDHESSVKSSNSFSTTYICKNASANPYGSHIYKTKDLKSFRITYFQKSGRREGGDDNGSRERATPRKRDEQGASERTALSAAATLASFRFRCAAFAYPGNESEPGGA